MSRVVYGMPAVDYFAVEAMSASGATKILRSPRHYRLDRDTPRESTAAMDFGTAVHSLILEPDKEAFIFAPKFDKRTTLGKEGAAAFEAAHAGSTLPRLDGDACDLANACASAIHEHPAARRLLDGAKTEVSCFWDDGEYQVPCKARLDITNLGGVVDVKTTVDASKSTFGRSAATWGYHRQAAHYWRAHEAALGGSPEFYAIIAVESEPPHAVACYLMPREAIIAGMRQMDEALARYKRARQDNRWQAYDDIITPLEFPAWALKE